MDFENDVFISYAHLDNQVVIEGQAGWISKFDRALKIRLGQLLGREPRIWRDPKLQGNDFFADTLLERLPKVAALVAVLSPRYVNSDWCQREMSSFHQVAEATGGSRIGDKSRLFKVIKTPLPLERHPAEVQPLLGYEFFCLDPETGRAQELDPGFGPEIQARYWQKLDNLAYDLCNLLQLLSDHATPAQAAGTIKGTSIWRKPAPICRNWRVDGRGNPVVLSNHPGEVMDIAFSPDSRHVVTASRDGTARLWSADGKGEELVLRGHTDAVITATFSSDGSHVVTASRDGTARYWRVTWPTLLDYFRQATNACLSPAQREHFLNEKPIIALDKAAACEHRSNRPALR